MNTKLLTLRDALRRQLSATRLRDWLPSRGNLLFTLLVALCLIAATTSGVLAAPQRMAAQAVASTATIPYQGRLADASGAPLTGAYTMAFSFYNVASGGSSLWTENWNSINSVQVTNGLFNVLLGSLEPIPQGLLTGNSSLWLGIAVGADAEMTPRVQLGSAPFAMQAQHAERANSLSAPDGDPAGAVIVDNNGNIGIGTTNPTTKVQIVGQGALLNLQNNDPTASTNHVAFQMATTNSWLQLISYGDGYVGDLSASGGDSVPLSGAGMVFEDGQSLIFANYLNKPFYFIQGAGGWAGPVIIPLTIAANGNVGIGTGTTTPSNVLTVAQGRGNVLADGYSIYSSGRWKENVAPIGDALSIVRQLRGVTFDWKGSGKHDLGLIAEEVGKVLPQVVTYEANGQDARGVDYSRLVAVLVQAANEQQTTVTSQQQQINSLQQQNAALQQQNAALDARLTALERSGGAPVSGWNLLALVALAGGLLLLALIVYRFRSKLVRS